MKPLKIALLAVAAAAAYTLASRGRSPAISMHELDWPGAGDAPGPRRYRSLGHAAHHLGQLAGLTLPVTRVYVLRALAPSFREQIMIVTAMANDCPG
jgi:hypothetical protein